ncbi:MAG: hypothetical protein AABY22_07940 [Nanoarchaeota archaeon]
MRRLVPLDGVEVLIPDAPARVGNTRYLDPGWSPEQTVTALRQLDGEIAFIRAIPGIHHEAETIAQAARIAWTVLAKPPAVAEEQSTRLAAERIQELLDAARELRSRATDGARGQSAPAANRMREAGGGPASSFAPMRYYENPPRTEVAPPRASGFAGWGEAGQSASQGPAAGLCAGFRRLFLGCVDPVTGRRSFPVGLAGFGLLVAGIALTAGARARR